MSLFARDQGMGPLLPYLQHVSTDLLLMAATVRWQAVSDEQRRAVHAELSRRGIETPLLLRTEQDKKDINLLADTMRMIAADMKAKTGKRKRWWWRR